MAPVAKRIPKQDWNRHEDTIRTLYHVRRLPLHSQNGENVQKIMRDEHRFFATTSQYEAYLKRLGQPKNLKKKEWRAVHAIMDKLSADGIETRVTISGKVLDKDDLNRRKRHAFSAPESSNETKVALPPPNRLLIETRGPDDNTWSLYTGENTVANASSSPSANENTITEPEVPTLLPTLEAADANPNLSSLANVLAITSPNGPIPSAARENSALIRSSSAAWSPSYDLRGSNWFSGLDCLSSLPQQLDLPPWTLNELSTFGNFDSSATANENWSSALDLLQPSENTLDGWHDLADYENLYRPQSLFESQPSFEFAQPASANSRWDILSPTRFPRASDYRASPLDMKSRSCPKILLRSLLHQAAQRLPKTSMTGDFGKQPHLDDVLDSLFSLLPENSPHENSEHNSELAFKEGDSGIFYQALFYSIANGFAGLTNIPPGAILKMLRQGDMSSRLIEWINSCPHIQAKCLADNLFRAAVEACDEDALMLVLKATDGTPSAIEPNQVVCKLGNRKYTPIELAAKLRHLNIVNRLLAANVDVNKTYGQLKYPECGALELAIRKYGDFEPVDVKLVQNILRFGAEVRGDLISAAIRWGQTEVIDELVSRFLPTSHRERFEKSVYALLQGIAHHLGNEHATRLIKRIFEHCRIDTCNCLAVHTREVENTLREAARRGNIELVKFLRPHTKKTVGLPAAVKSGNRELIDFLLSHGADVGEVALSEFKFRNEKFGSETTPLAEAIRSQNKELVIEFEILGAMSHVSQKAHFRAATIAAVEINDCNYLERIFQQAPAFETSREWSSCLRLPLSIAIHNDNIETALLLLEKGAEVNEETRIFSVNQNGSVNGPSLVLMEALRKKHRALVNAILDADFDFDGQSAAMELAAMWGDMPVIEGMIATGARADDGMIGAVKTRNGKLLDFLIRLGASLRVRSESKETLLQAAAVNQDGHMISLLILHGADPADEGAFLSAIEMSDPRTFDTLLEAFSGRYPNGKLGFGGVVLIKAIEKDDIQLLNALLAAKLDVKSFVRENYSEITPLGFAIKHCKGADRGLAGVRKLIPHGNTNGVVFRERSEIGPILGMSGKTALILAVETRNEEMVHLLLKNNANIHEPARRGLKRTPLQRACEIGSFKMVKLLLASGATVNEQPAERDGATSLQLAAKSGSIKIAEFLLSRGAIVHETQCKVRGYTAFEAAAGNGRLEMMIFLWDKVAGMGFTTEQMERAKHLAISGNHRGCADYIDTLSPPLPFLEAGSSSAFI